MPDDILRHRAECLTIDELVDEGDVVNAADRFITMWREHPEIHDVLRQRWQICGQRLRRKRPLPTADLDAWVAVRDTCFSEDKASRWLVAEILNRMERWEEVLKRFPDEHRAVAPAMLALGRNAEVAKADWATPLERIAALIGMGDVDGALRSPDLHRSQRAALLCKIGKADEAAQIEPYPALIYLGQIEKGLENNSFGGHANEVLILVGRLEEAAGAGVPGSPTSGKDANAMKLLGHLDEAEKAYPDIEVRFNRMLNLVAAGRLDEAKTLRALITGNRNATGSRWFTHYVGLPLVDVALGDATALRKALEQGAQVTGTWGGRMGAVCKTALDPASDDAVLALPWRTETAAWLAIAHALRAELANDRAGALAAWTAYSALPGTQRMLDGFFLEVDIEALAAWRIATLKP